MNKDNSLYQSLERPEILVTTAYASTIEKLKLNNRLSPLNTKESNRVVDVCYHLACKLEWTEIENIASKSILVGTSYQATIELYRYWIEALKRLNNLNSLNLLGIHLYKQRKNSDDALGLAIVCFVLSNKKKYSKILLKNALKENKKSYFIFESFYLYKIFLNKKKSSLKDYLKMLSHKRSNYYSLIQNIDGCSLLNDAESLKKSYFIIKKNHRSSLYLDYSYGYLTFLEKDYKKSLLSLRKINRIKVDEKEIKLLMAKAFIELGDYLQAEKLFVAGLKNDKIDYCWYDYYFGADLYCKLWKRYKYKKYKNKALSLLETAKELSKGLEIGQGYFFKISNEINRLKNKKIQSNAIWVVRISNKLLPSIEKNLIHYILCPNNCKQGDTIIFVDATHEKSNIIKILGNSKVVQGPKFHKNGQWFCVTEKSDNSSKTTIDYEILIDFEDREVNSNSWIISDCLKFTKIKSDLTDKFLKLLDGSKIINPKLSVG